MDHLTPDDLQRPSWKKYFFDLCRAVASRSIDHETQVGCVITNPNHRIVSTGYNAFPAGVNDQFWPRHRGKTVKIPHVEVYRSLRIHRIHNACEGFDLPAYDPRLEDKQNWKAKDKFYEADKYAAMTHAEANAIVSAGQDLHGCILYTLLFPCNECAKLIITAGIRCVVYESIREEPSWAIAKELFIQSGVSLVGP